MGRICLLFVLVTLTGVAEARLYLKTRVINTSDAMRIRSRKSHLAQADSGGRVHLLVQFEHLPGDEDTQTLAERGATVLGYVHENGVMLSTRTPSRLTELGLSYIGKLEAADKISPMLLGEGTESRPVLIEIHSDVSIEDGRRIALLSGAVLTDSPDLAAHHFAGERHSRTDCRAGSE
jgi:hypothetical protein